MGILGVISCLYGSAVSFDRRTRRKHRLPLPVVSVGNIAIGGRAKTPMTIEVGKQLRSLGRIPVVLTRGYGRSSARSLWIRTRGEDALELWDLDRNEPCRLSPEADLSELVGDEALEIAIQAHVDVLVCAERARAAKRFLEIQALERPRLSSQGIFILDDGFQHWSLERDLDIVIIRTEDLCDQLIPEGRLREKPQALERAQLILELGSDFFKRSIVPNAHDDDPNEILVITTRAPDPDFKAELERVLGNRPFTVKALRDHATRREILDAKQGFRGRVLMGWKEYAKFLGPASLESRTSIATDDLIGLSLEFVDGGRRLENALRKLVERGFVESRV